MTLCSHNIIIGVGVYAAREDSTKPVHCSVQTYVHWFSRKVLLLPLMTNSFEVVQLQKGFR